MMPEKSSTPTDPLVSVSSDTPGRAGIYSSEDLLQQAESIRQNIPADSEYHEFEKSQARELERRAVGIENCRQILQLLRSGLKQTNTNERKK